MKILPNVLKMQGLNIVKVDLGWSVLATHGKVIVLLWCTLSLAKYFLNPSTMLSNSVIGLSIQHPVHLQETYSKTLNWMLYYQSPILSKETMPFQSNEDIDCQWKTRLPVQDLKLSLCKSCHSDSSSTSSQKMVYINSTLASRTTDAQITRVLLSPPRFCRSLTRGRILDKLHSSHA